MHPTLLNSSFFFNDAPTPEIYTLSLHDALPICSTLGGDDRHARAIGDRAAGALVRKGDGEERRLVVERSEEHTSELQSQFHLVCRLLLEKKKIIFLVGLVDVMVYIEL